MGQQEDESYYPSLRLKVGTSTSAVGPKIDYSLLANRQSVNFVMPDHTVNIYRAPWHKSVRPSGRKCEVRPWCWCVVTASCLVSSRAAIAG